MSCRLAFSMTEPLMSSAEKRKNLRRSITYPAFIDLGDQFIAIAAGRSQGPDDHRHFGLVVDDKAAVRAALEEAGVEILPGRGLDFHDPWGNRFEVVQYDEIQFTKAPAVLRGMDLAGLGKTAAARDELARKGLA